MPDIIKINPLDFLGILRTGGDVILHHPDGTTEFDGKFYTQTSENPPVTRFGKQQAKKIQRRNANVIGKAIQAEKRRAAKVDLGKTVIVTEVDGVKKYAFPPKQKEPPTPPRLQWLSGKTFKHGNPSKTRPGRKPEQIQAFAENASRTLATEIEKATSVPTVDGTPVVAAAA